MQDTDIVRLVATIGDNPTVAEIDTVILALGGRPRTEVGHHVDALLDLRVLAQQAA